MKKYGDDADLFHDQGTRVEESKKWHGHNQTYRSQPNPNYSKPSYTHTYKPKTTKKSTYKPDYSKTYHQSGYSKTYHNPSPSKTKRQYRKRQSYNVISVEEANRRFKQNKSTQSSNSRNDNILMALLCICGILSFWISVALLENPIGFFPILFGLLLIIYAIWGVFEKLTKINKSFKNNDSFKPINEWKTCPGCGRKLIKVQKKCPYCKHDFKKIKNDEKTLINYLFDCHDDKINGTRLSKTKVISWIVAIISGILTDIHICLIPNSQGIYAANLIFSFFLFGAIFGLLTYFVGKLVSKILNKVI